MEIEYKGANCIEISANKAVAVIDPKLSLVGLKDYLPKGAIQIATSEEFVVGNGEPKLTIDGPGEYEVSSISVKGIAAGRHIDTDLDEHKATIYRVEANGIRVGIIGHVNAKLSDAQLEDLGVLDVLCIPVGGRGYTLDAHNAAAITRQIGPKAVIPTHYADKGINYEVPQDDLTLFRKELGASLSDTVAKFKIKSSGTRPEALSLVEVTRTS